MKCANFFLAAIFLIASPWQTGNAQAATDHPAKQQTHASSAADNAARAAKLKADMKAVNESKSGQWFGKMLDNLAVKIKSGQKKNKLSFKQQMEVQRAKRLAEQQAKHKAKEEERARRQAKKLAREKNQAD